MQNSMKKYLTALKQVQLLFTANIITEPAYTFHPLSSERPNTFKLDILLTQLTGGLYLAPHLGANNPVWVYGNEIELTSTFVFSPLPLFGVLPIELALSNEVLSLGHKWLLNEHL